MSKFYLFRIVVQTPEHGELAGDWSNRLTSEEVAQAKKYIRDNWANLDYLSLTVGDDEIIVPAEVLARSITCLEVLRRDGEVME